MSRAFKKILCRLAFHSNEKPRGWVRALMFKPDRTVRKLFRRVVFRKNGNVRAEFSAWMLMNHGVAPKKANSPENSISQKSHIEQPPSAALRTLLNLKPFEETVEQWKKCAVPKNRVSATNLSLLLCPTVGQRLVISIGHDNYKVVPGGVQLCIQREEEAVLARGDRYLNLHPFQPLPRLAHGEEASDPLMELTLDGRAIGPASISAVQDAVAAWVEAGSKASVVIHHLLGHSPELITSLVRATRGGKCLFWLHDFFSLCPSYTLQRNNVSFCNAPPVTSNACNLCVYGNERNSHLRRVQRFFEECDVEVISPSEVTLKFWSEHASYRTVDRHVVPHIALDWIAPPAVAQSSKSRSYTVAFLGTLAPHKGWPLFERLALNPRLSKRFRFLALTAMKTVPRPIRHVPVKATAENPNAMPDAVHANEVDLVLHWPTWPETFSLTTYEALIGGAYVITNPASGNVAATVQRLGRGVVLQDEEELALFFEDGRAEQACEDARRDRSRFRAKVQLSEISAPFLTDIG